MAYVKATTDSRGKQLVAGFDFHDCPDAKQRNDVLQRINETKVDIVHYCVLSDFLSGVINPEKAKKIRDHRFAKLARMIMEDGYNPTERCKYGNKGSLLAVQIGNTEYRERAGKITVNKIKEEI